MLTNHIKQHLERNILTAVICIRKITVTDTRMDVKPKQQQQKYPKPGSCVKHQSKHGCNLCPTVQPPPDCRLRRCVHHSFGSGSVYLPVKHQGALFTIKCHHTVSLGNGPYQGVAGSPWSSVDSPLVMCVKPRPRVVDHVQSRQLWVILWDCLDSFHGKLDEGSSTRAEGSGDVTAFTGLCLGSTGPHRPEQTIQLKAVRVKESRKRRINKSSMRLCPGAFLCNLPW